MADFTSVKKVDDNKIEVTKDVHIIGAKFTYDYNFLLSQQKAITHDLEVYTAQREAELKEVADLIAECDKLGIKPKAEEDIKDIKG